MPDSNKKHRGHSFPSVCIVHEVLITTVRKDFSCDVDETEHISISTLTQHKTEHERQHGGNSLYKFQIYWPAYPH